MAYKMMDKECMEVTELSEDVKPFFLVPAPVILDDSMDERRITVYSFFSLFNGATDRLFFSINNITDWLEKKPNRSVNGISRNIMKVVDDFKVRDYLRFDGNAAYANSVYAYWNSPKIKSECKVDRFAKIYVDELQKILDYKELNKKNSYMNNDTILLVFAYLRMKICCRKNAFLPEESRDYNEAVERRMTLYPEVYNGFYFEIAEDLGISSRSVSKAVFILNELDLIYSEALPRIKCYFDNGVRWRTDHTLFCNTYKREGEYLLASGKDYYMTEIENKKKKLELLKKAGGLYDQS